MLISSISCLLRNETTPVKGRGAKALVRPDGNDTLGEMKAFPPLVVFPKPLQITHNRTS